MSASVPFYGSAGDGYPLCGPGLGDPFLSTESDCGMFYFITIVVRTVTIGLYDNNCSCSITLRREECENAQFGIQWCVTFSACN